MIFKIITLGLMATFYVCYFAKMMSQKKHGISTDQLWKGKTGFVKFIEVTLKISTYVLPIIQLISILWYIGTAHIALRIKRGGQGGILTYNIYWRNILMPFTAT